MFADVHKYQQHSITRVVCVGGGGVGKAAPRDKLLICGSNCQR